MACIVWYVIHGLLSICIKFIHPTAGQCSNQRNLQYRIQSTYMYMQISLGSFFLLHATLNVCYSISILTLPKHANMLDLQSSNVNAESAKLNLPVLCAGSAIATRGDLLRTGLFVGQKGILFCLCR